MDAIFQTNFSQKNFIEHQRSLIQMPLKPVLDGPIVNTTLLVQMIDRHRIGDKLLSEPMIANFIDAYLRH